MAGFFPKSKILKAIILNIFQHSKLCISARPCNVLYFFLLMIVSFTKIIFFPFYQEAELEARREQERMEEYRRQIIERERQRMLQEHASKLLGFLPKVDISYTSCVLLLSFDCYWYLCSTIVVFVLHYVVYLSHNSSSQMTLRTWLIA